MKTWRHISQIVSPFSLHHLCTHLRWAYCVCLNKETSEYMKRTENIMNLKQILWKRLLWFTFKVPEHEHGTSMFESSSSSWQILQSTSFFDPISISILLTQELAYLWWTNPPPARHKHFLFRLETNLRNQTLEN